MELVKDRDLNQDIHHKLAELVEAQAKWSELKGFSVFNPTVPIVEGRDGGSNNASAQALNRRLDPPAVPVPE